MNYFIDKNTDEENIVDVSVFVTQIKERCFSEKPLINPNPIMIP